jgi:hypothetical protein
LFLINFSRQHLFFQERRAQELWEQALEQRELALEASDEAKDAFLKKVRDLECQAFEQEYSAQQS